MADKIRVLIIEDDPMVAYINRQYAEKIEGFTVVKEISFDQDSILTAEDLQEVDLLLLDIYLPAKNGIALLKEIRNSNQSIDVIIISAAKGASYINKAMQLGVVDYLIKPFTFERFKASLLKYKKLKEKLAGKSSFQQQEVDNLINRNFSLSEPNSPPAEFEKYVRNLPKGLDTTTLAKINQQLKSEKKELTTKEIAEKLNLSRVSVQRYLKYMLEEGVVKVRKEYGKVGRPQHYYQHVE
ncbi:MAG: response regulator [Halanaerobiales bacterium]|nr:response regulator [Halanaerobiales bacterium]